MTRLVGRNTRIVVGDQEVTCTGSWKINAVPWYLRWWYRLKMKRIYAKPLRFDYQKTAYRYINGVLVDDKEWKQILSRSTTKSPFVVLKEE